MFDAVEEKKGGIPWGIVGGLAAFAVRLQWNLWSHPLGHYIVSDMRGYDVRSAQILATPSALSPVLRACAEPRS